MMKSIYFIVPITAILLLSVSSAFSQEAHDPMEGMKTYYMAFLKAGPNRGGDSATVMKIQEAHMAHINQMHQDGKLVMAGPFLDNGEFRGIFVFDVKSQEDAEKLTAEDPAVKAGRLVMEVHPWMAKQGTTLP